MRPQQRKIWQQVVDRDGGVCQDCGRPGSHVHHIVSRMWESKNMIVLCVDCHLYGGPGGNGAHTHKARKRHLHYLREKHGYEYAERKYLEALEENI